jgi:tetratricopeptide (TPR) repeat protein
MGIKIKKKTSSSDVEPEVLEGEVDGNGFDENVDALPEEMAVTLPAFTGGKKASLLEQNPRLIFAGIGAVAALVVLVSWGFDFMEASKVEKSSSLNPAFNAYFLEVEGSPTLEPLKERENLKLPTLHPSLDKKWEAVYEGANAALPNLKGAPLEVSASLLKASAAVKLGKSDEAIAIYGELSKNPNLDSATRVSVELGNFNAHASAGAWDKAMESLKKAEAGDEEVAKFLRYHKARVLEVSGKPADAKELYHEILESDPLNPYKADIERRIATL